MKPLVTILIPTYNRSALLRHAIESAQHQVYDGDIEIIVLDDHSPDDTAAVVTPYLSDPRVRYFGHPENVGIAGNWKKGIQLVCGEYFCFLHDDDTFEPEFIQSLVEPLVRDPGLVLAFCDHWVMMASGERLTRATDEASVQFGRSRLRPGVLPDAVSAALVDFAVPIGATLLRRSAIRSEMIDPAARGAIDCWLFYQCLRSGGGAFYVSKRLMNYRLHDGSMSASMPLHMAAGHIHRTQALVEDPLLERLRPVFSKQLRQAREDYGLNLVAAGRPREARGAP